MLGPVDYSIWFIGFIAEVYMVVCCLLRKEIFRYFSLNFYILAAGIVTVGNYIVIQKDGFWSMQYRYFYYYSESVLIILMFFVIMHFYQRVFDQMNVSRYIKGAAVILLGTTALFSYLVIHQNKDHLTSRFVVELGQNLYFVGVVLTYLLWGAILKLRETRTRLVQLVLALGIFFSADAATYALRNLFPALQIEFLKFIPPLVGAFLPIAWAYTMTKIPEEARLLTARLATNHQ